MTTKTIRFCEASGVLPAAVRRPSGYREYDEGAVGRLAIVRAVQAAGLTLAEIRDVIAVRDSRGRHAARLRGEAPQAGWYPGPGRVRPRRRLPADPHRGRAAR